MAASASAYPLRDTISRFAGHTAVMSQILPTLLVLLLTGLIGWGLLFLVKRLDSMGGEGHAVKGEVKKPDEVKSDA